MKLLVFKLPHSLAEQLMKNPFVNFGITKIKIKKFIPFFICHCCSGLGHTDNNCFKRSKKHTPSCPNCAMNHSLRDCKSDFIAKCTNFSNHNKKDPLANLNTDHSSWDTKCPLRNKAINFTINNNKYKINDNG